MVAAPTPVEIFCSYAHEDEAWLQKLETHLSLLKRQGLISLWHHRLITPGTDWAKSIDTHLETASVILLLVSADFFASDYCYGIEMQRALERQEAGEARVLPILVRPVEGWQQAPFAHLQALPTDAKPLAAQRNKETALADVAAGIRRVIVEELPQLSASTPRTALPKIWNIPYPRNPFFLGRETELAQVRQHLQAGQAAALAQPQAISGLGGIGKTQLALEYAYCYHQDYQIVLWARAESAEALVSSYVTIASLLRLPEREAKEQDITVQAVKVWLQTHRDWLLILDNADELTLLPDFLPPTLGGHLLLTTRATATGRLAHRLEIETLLPEQGALFLLRRAGLITPDASLEQASLEERELALSISRELGGLPLALDQAGAYLEEAGTDLGSYWHLYQKHRVSLLQKRGGLVADHPDSVATTWSLSFERIKEKDSSAAKLLCFCAFLSPDDIPEEILTTHTMQLALGRDPVAEDPLRFNQSIEALRAYSLVRRDPKEKTLSIHRLVQAILQDAMKETEKRSWAGLVMLAVYEVFPHAEYDTWGQCERLLSQALAATQVIERYYQVIKQHQGIGEAAGQLLYETASYLHDHARYAQAEPLYQRALTIREQQFGPEHSDVAWSLNRLATLYKEQGKYIEAEPLLKRGLHILEQQFGPEHPNVTRPLNNLAEIYHAQGKHTEAELLYLQALHISEQQSGPEHLDVAYPLNNLAILYREQGKYEKAEPLYQRALAIRERQLGPEHPDVARTLNGLASLSFDQEKYVEAEPLYRRAFAIRERQLGPEHPDTMYSLNNLAVLYKKQKKYVEAELLFKRVLSILEQQLEPEHPLMAFSLDGLASLYREMGRYEDAKPFYQQALRIFEQRLGPEHFHVAYPLNGLALLSEAQGRYVEAESLSLRALHIKEQQLGLEHLHVAALVYNLATLYHSQGKYEEAGPLYERVLHIYRKKLGLEHPHTVETIYDLAQLREAQGNHEEAKSLYAHVLATRKQVLGLHDSKTTETRKHLIALLHTMGQHEEAAQLEAVQSEQ